MLSQGQRNEEKIAQFNDFLLYYKIPHYLNLWKWKIAETMLCINCKCNIFYLIVHM